MNASVMLAAKADWTAGIIGLAAGIVVAAVLIGAFVYGRSRKEKEPPPLTPSGPHNVDDLGDMPPNPNDEHKMGWPLHDRETSRLPDGMVEEGEYEHPEDDPERTTPMAHAPHRPQHRDTPPPRGID